MKKLTIALSAMLAAFQIGFAQDKDDTKDQMRELRNELFKERQLQSKSSQKGMGLTAVSADDVGEPDSFGKKRSIPGHRSERDRHN
jgi:hypothetical protein